LLRQLHVVNVDTVTTIIAKKFAMLSIAHIAELAFDYIEMFTTIHVVIKM